MVLESSEVGIHCPTSASADIFGLPGQEVRKIIRATPTSRERELILISYTVLVLSCFNCTLDYVIDKGKIFSAEMLLFHPGVIRWER